MEKDLALQPMAANGIQSGIFGAHVLECGKASQYFSKYSGAGHIAGAFVKELVADADSMPTAVQDQKVLDAVSADGVYFFWFLSVYGPGKICTSRISGGLSAQMSFGSKYRNLSKSVDELRAEVAVLRDTVQLDLTEKLQPVGDLAAEARSEMMQGQLLDFHQHSEVQALSGSLRNVVHEEQEDVQRLGGESSELIQLQKQLDMRTEVGANELAQVGRGLKDQEKLVQRISPVSTYEPR